VAALVLSSAGIFSEVRRAWRIIPPRLDVPTRWVNAWPRVWDLEAVWFWPKSWALIGMGAGGLLFNVVFGLVIWFMAEPNPILPGLLACGVAFGTFVITTTKLRLAVGELRRRGKMLRE
jgi:hypothetical protein